MSGRLNPASRFLFQLSVILMTTVAGSLAYDVLERPWQFSVPLSIGLLGGMTIEWLNGWRR